MKPVRTASSNLVYAGPTPDIADLHCERLAPGHIRSVWWFTPEERAQVARGANLSLTLHHEPIPPVSLHLTADPGVGEDAPEVLERLELFGQSGGLNASGDRHRPSDRLSDLDDALDELDARLAAAGYAETGNG